MITFTELQNKSKIVYPAVLLDLYINHRYRHLLRRVLLILMSALFVVMVVSIDPRIFMFIPDTLSFWLIEHTLNLRGWFFVAFAIWCMTYLLEAFYLSYYFKPSNDVDFDVARLVFSSNAADLTKSFIRSEIGQITLFRLGIVDKSIEYFLSSPRKPVDEFMIELRVDYDSEFISLKDYAEAIYNSDTSLRNFFEQHRITKDIFLGAVGWVDQNDWKYRNSERWWVRSNLARIPSIGRNWSFGKTYTLEKFGSQIMSTNVYYNLGEKWRLRKDLVAQLESVLIKDSGANAMIVSPTSELGLEIVASLGKMIFLGNTLQELENKRIFVIDLSLLLTESGDKKNFEINFINILSQANQAGNVILVFPHMSNFIENANNFGVDVSSLLAEILESDRIQVIAISDQKGFHETIETNMGLMQNFEKILVNDIGRDVGIRILMDEAIYQENKHGVIFTYQSLLAIADGAEKYFMSSTFEDKIIDLLQEVIAKTRSDKSRLITAEKVYQVLSIKTGVPQSGIGYEERQKLISLEELLHERVIGQNEAIGAVAIAMRRSRAGINNPKRPIGSFLFLGPTGVGKTETTKALAESFFGSEKNIIRFDMSEFTGEDATEKLIGGSRGRQTGVLAEKILQQQYGVLLLDEFEKTTGKVMDLFLQILDEGQFTDARGQQISARNLIIVATSNAGSDLIYKNFVEKQELAHKKDEIIDELVKQRIFKPELLNRFDGVILFHPLSPEHVKEVAKLMLRKLDFRLREKGMSIDIGEEVLEYLVSVGSDPKFGARAMNRAIQDEIEGLIADAIINDTIKSGDYIGFKKSEKDPKKLQLFVSNKVN